MLLSLLLGIHNVTQGFSSHTFVHHLLPPSCFQYSHFPKNSNVLCECYSQLGQGIHFSYFSFLLLYFVFPAVNNCFSSPTLLFKNVTNIILQSTTFTPFPLGFTSMRHKTGLSSFTFWRTLHYSLQTLSSDQLFSMLAQVFSYGIFHYNSRISTLST